MTDLTTQANKIRRSQSKLFHVFFSGLALNTKHNPSVDGVDHSFATRQYGKGFAESLISDNNGNLELFFMLDIPLDNTYDYDVPSESPINYQSNDIESSITKTATRYIVFEVLSPDETSYAQRIFDCSIALTSEFANDDEEL